MAFLFANPSSGSSSAAPTSASHNPNKIDTELDALFRKHVAPPAPKDKDKVKQNKKGHQEIVTAKDDGKKSSKKRKAEQEAEEVAVERKQHEFLNFILDKELERKQKRKEKLQQQQQPPKQDSRDGKKKKSKQAELDTDYDLLEREYLMNRTIDEDDAEPLKKKQKKEKKKIIEEEDEVNAYELDSEEEEEYEMDDDEEEAEEMSDDDEEEDMEADDDNEKATENTEEMIVEEENTILEGEDAKPGKEINIGDNQERDKRTIFIGNISKECFNEKSAEFKQFRKLFLQHGGIEAIRFRSVAVSTPSLPRKVAIAQGKLHERRDSLNAYLVYKKLESVQSALTLNGAELLGKHLRVDTAVPSIDNKRSIFVGNLPFVCNEEELRAVFEPCGDIENVRVIRDKKTNFGKGIAYVTFSDKASVALAIKLNEVKFKERPLRVSRCKSLTKKGTKPKKQYEGTKAAGNPKKIDRAKKFKQLLHQRNKKKPTGGKNKPNFTKKKK